MIMSDYAVEMEGKYKLAEINSAIAGEEAGASEFKSSTVKASPDTGDSNILTFSVLSPGTIPKPLIIVKQGDPQPPGTKQVWSGVMVVDRTLTSVIAYREV
jgi:hypothetical protein